MDVHQQDLHGEERYASLSDEFSLQFQLPTGFGPTVFAAIEPATSPVTVHLLQLVVPPGFHELYECTANTWTPPLFLFADFHLAVDTLAVPPGEGESPLSAPSSSSAPPIYSTYSHSDEGEPGMVSTIKGTPFSPIRTGVTAVWPSSRRAESPRSTRRGASVHPVSARLVAKYFGGTTKLYGTSTPVDRTRGPVRSLRHIRATCASSDSRGGTRLPATYKPSTQVRYSPSID